MDYKNRKCDRFPHHLLCVSSISINLLVFYHKYRSLIGYTTIYSVIDSE